MNEKLLRDMKQQMKENPVTKHWLDTMVADGINEDTALDIMIAAWLSRRR